MALTSSNGQGSGVKGDRDNDKQHHATCHLTPLTLGPWPLTPFRHSIRLASKSATFFGGPIDKRPPGAMIGSSSEGPSCHSCILPLGRGTHHQRLTRERRVLSSGGKGALQTDSFSVRQDRDSAGSPRPSHLPEPERL